MRVAYRQSEAKLRAIDEKRQQGFSRLLAEVAAGNLVVYADEISFNPYSTRAKAWAHTGTNQPLFKGGLQLPPLYALVCMSSTEGLVSYVLSERPIRSEDALSLFAALSGRDSPAGNLLFWDNLPLHRSGRVLAAAGEAGFRVLFNAPYSSAWHCIETAFAQVKRQYRQGLLEQGFS
jgi:hypothetical protein